MILVLLSCLVVSALIWVLQRWTRVRRYWADRGVPHLPPHPLLGSLTFLTRQNPAIWMRQLYDHFRSPYIGIWLFWRPALIITDPELARRILVADADKFRDRFLGAGKNSTDRIGSLNLFTVNDPVWSSIRRRLTPVFTSAKLKTFESLVQTKCIQLVQRIKNENKMDKVIDLRSLYSDLTTDIISIAAFGFHGNATLEGKSPMREVTKDFMKFSVHRGLSWSSIFFFPEIVDVFRFKMFPKESTDYLCKIFRTVVAKRGGYEKTVTRVNDLLDALLKMKQDASKEGEEMTEDLLIAQAAIFLQGGFDSTASALTFTTYELAYSPDIQNRLYKEVLEAKRNLDNREFDSSDLMNLPYLNAVINETLRKYPAMGWLDRLSSTDYDIDKNLKISAGTPVYINAYSMHYDTNYFPDPETFNPDRFLPENEGNIKPHTFMPFGIGPRHCIGMRFSQQSYRHALATLVLNFEIQPLPNTCEPKDCPIEKHGLFLMPGGIMSVKLIERDTTLI